MAGELDILWEAIGFKPTDSQRPILETPKRFILVAGGERGGKSRLAAMYLFARYFAPLPVTVAGEKRLYWLVAADYERTRAEFDYLVEAFGRFKTKKGSLIKKCSGRVDPGEIVLQDDTVIRTRSSKDPRTLAGEAPDGIVACEASQLDLESYHKLSYRIGERRGWLFMSGTFEGSLGWYPRLYEAWKMGYGESQSFSLPSWTNLAIYPGGRKDPEILRMEKERSDDFFLERIAGIPRPPQGLVFPEFRMDLHVRPLEWLPNEPVYIWEDPGYGSESAHAIEAAQVIGGQVRIFDEIYERGKITEEVISMCQHKDWWKAREKFLVSDPSYKDAHHSMPAVSEVWRAKTGLYAGGEKVRINEGTERLKGFLKVNHNGEPSLVIDPKCSGLLSEFGACLNPLTQQLQAYRWKKDKDGNIVGDTPEDKYNHAIKAVIYGLVDRFGFVMAGERRRKSEAVIYG